MISNNHTPSTTIIIGGVAGGMSTATRLRRNDETMTIIVFEASGNVSFANCELPYHLSDTIPSRDSLLLQTPQSLKKRFNIDVHINTRITSINRDANTVTTDSGETYHYDNLVLSPGAHPFIPEIPGIERALTLRTVEDMDAIKSALHTAGPTPTVAIIGGGFIGLEVAENLQHLGCAVTIIERAPQIMGPLDPEMAQIVANHLGAHDVTVHTGAITTHITDTAVVLDNGHHIPAEIVIAAIGVRPANELAENAGLEIGARGGIVVDDYQRTSDNHIYALGDAAEKRDAIDGSDTLIPLAQTANRHGRLIADIITGRNVTSMPTLGTAIVGLFGLAAASTGWSEKRARSANRPIRIIHLHPNNHAGYYPGAAPLHMKLVIDNTTDDILGAQIIGHDGVDKRIDVIATALRAGLKARDLADLELAYAPQFGSAKDPINFAGFIDDNILAGEKTVQWHELDQRLADGALLIDVRTEAEYARGNIPGAINIPLDSIRDRIEDIRHLTSGRDTIVHCQVGLRGHLAVTLLRNLEVDTTNLDGGYLTWTHGQQVTA